MGNLQIKNVPEDVHDELRRRASKRRMTVRDYLLEMIERDQATPTMDEWLKLVAADPKVDIPAGEAARLIREGREERGARVLAAVTATR